jgi:poly-D-alanine transfer protein DltD
LEVIIALALVAFRLILPSNGATSFARTATTLCKKTAVTWSSLSEHSILSWLKAVSF